MGGVIGDPLLEELAEGKPGRPVGAQHGVARPDDLQRALPALDRRGSSPVERAQLAGREGLRPLTLDAVVIQFAPAVLVGDDLAAGVDERVDALR
jgi:hypothetical protein